MNQFSPRNLFKLFPDNEEKSLQTLKMTQENTG
jgi:hypothetical protein